MENNKDVIIGQDGPLRMKAGVDKACDAVRPTLGAVGMTAIIEFPGLDPIECDDGVTILKNLKFKDHYENLGLQKLRKAALRTSTEGGDGTATTTVLTQALVSEAFKEIGSDPSRIRDVRERLERGLQETLVELAKFKRDVTEEEIERIANISSLDSEVAKLIADIIKQVGVNGVVTVEKGSKIGYTSDVVKGARFDRGLISPYFINDHEKGTATLENPYIVIVDRKISTGEQVKSIMNSIKASGNLSVLFIADDIDGIALASLIQSSKTVTMVNAAGQGVTGQYEVACVRNPYNSSRARDFLLDIAALTGGTMISEQAGMRLDTAGIEVLGRAEKVIITQNNCTIIGGNSGGALDQRIKGIEKQIAETTSEYEKSMLEERLASLTGGIGVIRVGAYTDTDFNAKKYKFDNAVAATQAALQEGIVAGGGSALAKLKVTEPMFKKALVAPIVQMAKNAGMDEIEVRSSIGPYTVYTEDSQKVGDYDFDSGWDFKAKKLVNMFEAGIIDPFKVIRIALESATAIASDLIKVQTTIVNEDVKKSE